MENLAEPDRLRRPLVEKEHTFQQQICELGETLRKAAAHRRSQRKTAAAGDTDVAKTLTLS